MACDGLGGGEMLALRKLTPDGYWLPLDIPWRYCRTPFHGWFGMVH